MELGEGVVTLMRRIMLGVIIITVLIFLLTACAFNSSQQVESSDPEAGQEQDSQKLQIGEITDPKELEKFWQEYILDTRATIGNTWNFGSPEEIDPEQVVRYCWEKYLEEHGYDNLERVKESNNDAYFPLDKALQYTERYFNLENLDISKVPDYYYNPEKQAFTFYARKLKREADSYDEYRPHGINMTQVTLNTDDTLTVVIEKYNDSLNTRIEYRQIYTLKQRVDGSMYFISGHREYINNHLVSLEGDYQGFDKIQGFEGQMQELSMLGETDGKVILSYTPYNKEQKPSLMMVNPDTMIIEKEIEISEPFEFSDAKFSNGRIIVRLKYKTLVFNSDLEPVEEIALPEIITEKIDRDPEFKDLNGPMIPAVVFNGYDISGDLNRIVYADEVGVKLVNLDDDSERLLSETIPIENSKLIDRSYHWQPRFVADDKKVITTMSGYEGIMGFTLCDLEEGTDKKLNITAEGIYTGLIRYDTGLLAVNMCIYADSQGSEYRTLYLDFASGEVQEIELEKPGDTGFIRDYDYSYIGESYGAFITTAVDRNDHTESMNYLNRVNLDTLDVEQQILSIKATRLRILGVLADGRIIFWYDFNPSERGVGITR